MNKQVVLSVIKCVTVISVWRHEKGEGFVALGIGTAQQQQLLPPASLC